MHQFLRAIGFSDITKKQLNEVINNIIDKPEKIKVTKDSEGNEFAELSCDVAPNMGITVRGIYNDDDSFDIDYYYPYFTGSEKTTNEIIDIEKHSEKESYAGVCDDPNLGVTLIFYLQNVCDYLSEKAYINREVRAKGAVLSGLSVDGCILLPMKQKKAKTLNTVDSDKKDRKQLIAEARDGDEGAMESLTMEDIDLYSSITRRIQNEDILSIVTTYFMPYGIESDQYSVLGDIIELTEEKNIITNEKIYCIKVSCNDIIFSVCINKNDLIGSPNINREKIVDINVITNELFGLTAEELLAVEWIIWWLCSIHPDPLSAPEELYRKKENSILTKKNLERVISYYSVTYEQVRNSSLRKQIFYNKPFVITQKTKETIAVSFYLVQMMIADGLYWLIRDYYHNNHWGTKFIIAFGEMFEDYFEELAGLYLPKNSWHKIPEERKKSADYYVEVDEAVFLFELKSGLLGLGAKQQVPDVGQIDIFYNRNIKEAYEQLKASEQEYKGEKPVIKVFLLYESMTNTQMIVGSLPEIFEQDPRCYIMTIDDLEMLLATYKKDKSRFDDVVKALVENKRGGNDYKSVLEILNIYQAVGDMHFIGERDYFNKIAEKLKKELGTDQ